MKQLLSSLGLVISRDIKARIRKNLISPKTNKSGTTLVKSAKLVNSITYRVDSSTVTIGTNLKYARIQHEGGTIYPARAKYLAIPLTKEAAARKPRDFQNTFIAKGCIMRTLSDNTVEALYALKRSVEIPARPYMFVDDNTLSTIRSLAEKYVKSEVPQGAK